MIIHPSVKQQIIFVSFFIPITTLSGGLLYWFRHAEFSFLSLSLAIAFICNIGLFIALLFAYIYAYLFEKKVNCDIEALLKTNVGNRLSTAEIGWIGKIFIWHLTLELKKILFFLVKWGFFAFFILGILFFVLNVVGWGFFQNSLPIITTYIFQGTCKAPLNLTFLSAFPTTIFLCGSLTMLCAYVYDLFIRQEEKLDSHPEEIEKREEWTHLFDYDLKTILKNGLANPNRLSPFELDWVEHIFVHHLKHELGKISSRGIIFSLLIASLLGILVFIVITLWMFQKPSFLSLLKYIWKGICG